MLLVYTLRDEDLLLKVRAVLSNIRGWCFNSDSGCLIQSVYYISGQNQPNVVSSDLRSLKCSARHNCPLGTFSSFNRLLTENTQDPGRFMIQQGSGFNHYIIWVL